MSTTAQTEATTIKLISKRNNQVQDANKEKIVNRIQTQCKRHKIKNVDVDELSEKVFKSLAKLTPSSEIDILISETAAGLSVTHPEYAKLAACILISLLHKSTPNKFSEYFDKFHASNNEMFHPSFISFVNKYRTEIDLAIKNEEDYKMYDYFGFKTLERSYLLKLKGKIQERPQYLLMRVALALHMETADLESAKKTYEMLYSKLYTHATPTLFNAGLRKGNYSSCYLLTMAGNGDSIESIYDTLKNCALISKSAGGIGLSVSTVRASGSAIRGTNGTSNGLVPMLRVFNNTARYVDQCFGKDTIIFTKEGPKEISKIKIGDLVWTHLGNYKKVTKVLEYNHDADKVLLNLRSSHSLESVIVTDQHPFLALQNQAKGLNHDVIRNRIEKKLVEFDWIEAGKLQACEDFIVSPVSNDISQRNSKDFITTQNYTLSRIREITPETEYKDKLYDLEVADDHSYVTHVGAVHNGGGKRKGSFAIYLEPWHADIFAFLDLKHQKGVEQLRARDLFYGLWVPDLFMRRVQSGETWSLFCPNEAKGLSDVYGPEFDKLYEQYEQKGLARKTVEAKELWNKILEVQTETGTPYIVYKDSCNRKSNQQNLGTIRSSNLCVEIVEYTSKDEIAVCNLASIALPNFVQINADELWRTWGQNQGLVIREAQETKHNKNKLKINECFNHKKLYEVVQLIVKNLNQIIDINHYPVPEAKKSNLRHRPIGIGVQGLADTFMMLRLPYESLEAQQLNRDIFETIYYAALSASIDLAIVSGPYETFPGSPASRGLFQFDLWEKENQPKTFSGLWDWDSLRKRMQTFGLRNSLLVAPMPTATTSQILGNTESFEPLMSNLFLRKTLAGEFNCVNAFLTNDLIRLNLWNNVMREKIILSRGSIQNITEIPVPVRLLYKTVWEMSAKTLINMAADRGVFIDQSQSFNMYLASNDKSKLTFMHFWGWKRGLKSGCYYLRSLPAIDAVPVTVDPTTRVFTVTTDNTVTSIVNTKTTIMEKETQKENDQEIIQVCRRGVGCDSCGS